MINLFKFIFRYISPASGGLLLFIFLTLGFLDFLGLTLIVPFVNYMLSGDGSHLDVIPTFLEKLPLLSSFDERFFYSLLIGLFAIRFVAILVAISLSSWIAEGLQLKIRARITEVLHSSSLEAFEKNDHQVLLAMLNNYSGHIKGVVTQGFKVVSDAVLVSSVLIYVLAMDLKSFVSIGFFGAIAVLLVDRSSKSPITRLGAASNQAHEAFMRTAENGIRGFRELLSLNEINRFWGSVIVFASKFRRLQTIYMVIEQLPKYVYELLAVVVFVSFSTGFFGDKSDSGVFIAIAILMVRGLPLITKITNFLVVIRYSTDALTKLAKFDFDNKGHERFVQLSHEARAKNGSIDFDEIKILGLNHSYGNQKVLRGLNFEINRGEIIGMFGESGVGKSTFLDIFAGLRKPDSGEVWIDGESVCWRQLHGFVGYLPQSPVKIDGSVSENFTFRSDLSDIEAAKVADLMHLVELSDVIQKDSNFEKVLRSPMSNLSGGQLQRLAIARLLFHKKTILLMDEATTGLDPDLELRILIKLRRIGISGILVSHNELTLSRCDRTLRLTAAGFEG